MGLLDKLKTSIFGLKGATPPTFGTDPSTSLHNEFSTIGTPLTKWKQSSTKLPQPSKIDISDTKDSFKATRKYSDNKPS